jgi:hypothetical protein
MNPQKNPAKEIARTDLLGGFETNRYRTGWGGDATADSRDSGVGTPGSATSTRVDANWVCCASSRTDIIPQ